jgi:hypothetical protein
MTKYSAAHVANLEKISLFVCSPLHVGKKGILPSVFSHTFTVGCSIQRESIVSERELSQFVRNFLAGKSDRTWHGVLIGDCEVLRGCTLKSSQKRAFCVYDTAEKDNPAHGEIHQSQYVIDEADKVELRAKLFETFNSGVATSPTAYRSGSILATVC